MCNLPIATTWTSLPVYERAPLLVWKLSFHRISSPFSEIKPKMVPYHRCNNKHKPILLRVTAINGGGGDGNHSPGNRENIRNNHFLIRSENTHCKTLFETNEASETAKLTTEKNNDKKNENKKIKQLKAIIVNMDSAKTEDCREKKDEQQPNNLVWVVLRLRRREKMENMHLPNEAANSVKAIMC